MLCLNSEFSAADSWFYFQHMSSIYNLPFLEFMMNLEALLSPFVNWNDPGVLGLLQISARTHATV